MVTTKKSKNCDCSWVEHKENQRLRRWKSCAMTRNTLKKPVVCDGIGNLYNKTELMERLLSKQELPGEFQHIRKGHFGKDLIDCNITFQKGTQECLYVHFHD
eukprot:UN00361